jgi:hypothetical protein
MEKGPEYNSEWEGDQHMSKREHLVFRLMIIDEFCKPGKYNCKLCGYEYSYGSREYGGIGWNIGIRHYIEWHGHRPSEDQIDAIYLMYNGIRSIQEEQIKEGMERLKKS